QPDGSYTFQLNHKVSFLLFTPRVANASYNTKLRSISITKLNNSPGDSALCGSYYFDNDGLHTGTAMKNAGKKITLNLFTTDASGKEHYPFALSDFKDTDKCLYMVLQPGDHKLAITYEMVDSLGRKSDTQIQYVTHNKTTDKYEYKYTDSIAPATRWKVTRELKATAHTFTENGFTKVSHKLELETPEVMRFEIPYTYYEWGASSWIYAYEPQNVEYFHTYTYDDLYGSGGDGVAMTINHLPFGYPKNSDPSDAANYEIGGTPLLYTLDSYYRSHIKQALVPHIHLHPALCLQWDGQNCGFYRPGITPTGSYESEPIFLHGSYDNSNLSYYVVDQYGEYTNLQIRPYKQIIYRSIVRMPSANEMTYYLKYGDIHRDNTTLWKIDEYRGDTTLCRGGIWIKKRTVIEAEGHPFSTEKSAYQINGSDLDLRAQSPGNNYMFRHYNIDADINAAERTGGAVADVKYGVPADTSKYFFLPLLGYMHNVANSPGVESNYYDWAANKGQYKFVGAEGYYWTRTMWPNAIVSGQTNAYNLHGERESYYLHITPYYVALAWDKYGNRCHGMVGNQRPNRYRTMPASDRIFHVPMIYIGGYPITNDSDEFLNDWWFQ
ncbi:MAG: hypothetical protein IJ698_10555, partial [Prevotella sp.]|nr:hypothetical protein [Prevotella sp.]